MVRLSVARAAWKGSLGEVGALVIATSSAPSLPASQPTLEAVEPRLPLEGYDVVKSRVFYWLVILIAALNTLSIAQSTTTSLSG